MSVNVHWFVLITTFDLERCSKRSMRSLVILFYPLAAYTLILGWRERERDKEKEKERMK